MGRHHRHAATPLVQVAQNGLFGAKINHNNMTVQRRWIFPPQAILPMINVWGGNITGQICALNTLKFPQLLGECIQILSLMQGADNPRRGGSPCADMRGQGAGVDAVQKGAAQA